MSDFPALENFLSAYFHQDWRVEHDAPDAVVSSFLDGEDAEQVAAVRAELARLSAQDLGEEALGKSHARARLRVRPDARRRQRARLADRKGVVWGKGGSGGLDPGGGRII